MTTIDNVMRAAINSVRMVKANKAAEMRDTNLATTILAHRGEVQVAMVSPYRMDRDTMLTAVDLSAHGFCADLMAIAYETYEANSLINPLTGRTWVDGDMQRLVDDHDGYARGWVRDAVMISVLNRAGDARHRMMPYQIKDKQVIWLAGKDTAAGGLTDIGGLVPELLHAAMAKPMLNRAALQKGFTGREFGMSSEAVDARIDCSVAKMLMQANCLVGLSADDGSEREQVITKIMRPGTDQVIRAPGGN